MSATDHLNLFIMNREGFMWRTVADDRYELFSGEWKNGLWRHDVVLVHPATPRTQAGSVVLYITGGEVNDLDLAEAQAIADRSRISVAMLFHIPNQPIFDLWEDDLIAHTFEQFLDTGDADWPLLFPMARAATRAIDMLEELGFQRFVVTGASKRGWTTWLAGATGDPRIVGIAPMVIDNLNFPAQMAHQIESWGAYSEQIEDYTSRELQESMDTDRGADLTVMMDPINYIDRIRCPILIVNGANDRYWTVDALSLYWDKLPSTARCLIVPNAGHLLGDKKQMIETLSFFALAAVHDFLLPAPKAEFACTADTIGAIISSPSESKLWVAYSPSLDFRDSEWTASFRIESFDPKGPIGKVIRVLGNKGEQRKDSAVSLTMGAALDVGEGDVEESWLYAALRTDREGANRQNVAVMAEFRFSSPTGSYSLSTPVAVFCAGQNGYRQSSSSPLPK